jgi:MFS family permease
MLAPVFTVIMIDAISSGLFLPILPFYATHFGASPVLVGALLSAYYLCQFLAAPFLGQLADRVGRKQVLIASQFGTLGSLILLAFAKELPTVFVARMIDGLTAGNVAVAVAYAIDQCAPSARKQVIGMVSAAMGIGTMFGPALSGALAQISLTAPIWAAAICSSIGIIASLLLRSGPGRPDTSLSTPQKLRIRELLSSHNARLAATMLMIFYFSLAMFSSQLAMVLSARFRWQGHAFGPTEVGLIFTIAGAVNIVVQLFFINLVSRLLSDVQLIISSLALLAVGVLVLGVTESVETLLLAVVMISVGIALARPSLVSILSLSAPAHRQGALMGLNQSLVSAAHMLAPTAAGILVARQLDLGWAGSIAGLSVIAMLIAVNLRS